MKWHLELEQVRGGVLSGGVVSYVVEKVIIYPVVTSDNIYYVNLRGRAN